MDKIKNKYEVILGFVTLVISFSAFKEELNNIQVDLGYIKFSLAKYFLCIVFGFAVSLYLYIGEKIVRDTKIGSWKVFDYAIKIAYTLFTGILITPILILLNIIVIKATYLLFGNFNDIQKNFSTVANIISFLSAVLSTILVSKTFLTQRKVLLRAKIEEQEIKDLENASKFFHDGYYAHSILESYKALEAHLYNKILDKNIRVSRYRINDILQIALKENIINQNERSIIDNIRGLRNSVPHSEITDIKEQAEFSLNYVREILKR